MKTILIVMYISLLSVCGGNKASDPFEPNRGLDTDTKVVSPNYVSIFRRKPAEITPQMVAEVDKGLLRVRQIAAFNGYTKRIEPGNFWVELVGRNPKCINPGYTLSFNTPAGTNYDGSEFDKDPKPGAVELCIAGQFHGIRGLSVDTSPFYISVVADAGVTANAAEYEAEHAIAMVNDQPLYLATLNHQNGGHPILRQPPSLAVPPELKGVTAGTVELDGKKMPVLLTK